MKYFIIILLSCLLYASPEASGKNHRRRGEPRTEVGLMNNVLGCLQYKDTVSYFNLFPPFDTLWRMVMHNPDHSPEAVKELNELKEHPESLLAFDPYYNRSIMARFCQILQKGEDSGIHWNSIVMQRYELYKEPITSKTLIGYDHIAPERFKGYIFVRDLLGRLTFCISITEIQKIEGYFFGGQILNILEASTIDQYMNKEQAERKYFLDLAENNKNDSLKEDSIKNGLVDTTRAKTDTPASVKIVNLLSIPPPPPDDDKSRNRKEVIDRKYYEGKFDEEIPVKLFVRYMRSPKSSDEIIYDGLYKFGDQVNYVKLNITRKPGGQWTMEDDPPVGVLELELKDKVYTGSWTNVETQDGYDAELKQTDIPQKKLEQLDNMLETGHMGSVAEDLVPQKKEKAKPKVQDQNNDEGY